MTTTTPDEPIYLDNTYEPKFTITRKNATTNVREAATGLAGLSCRLSLTKNGTAIHATLDKPLTEMGALGIYFPSFAGADLRSYLVQYDGSHVWVVAGNGTTIQINKRVPVLAVRPPVGA